MDGQLHVPTALSQGKRSNTQVWEVEGASGPVFTCAENLFPTGIQSSDHPDFSESLYGPRCPAIHLLYRDIPVNIMREMLLINCEDIRNTNYTLQETLQFHMYFMFYKYFIAGLGNFRYFLVFCSLDLQNQFSASVQQIV